MAFDTTPNLNLQTFLTSKIVEKHWKTLVNNMQQQINSRPQVLY